ncbi:PKD domain-containing protein (plasmid) [Alkalihalophilus sp. As8PL]|uniref:PKD domain-containing protein n=1 Tax=Alkalihalophilus sp. As8PL TaxID=3237103 RepID=A0AB39BMU0_9BACI
MKTKFITLLVFLLLFTEVSVIFAHDYPTKSLNDRRTDFIRDLDLPYSESQMIAPNGQMKYSDSIPIIVDDIAYGISTETGRVIAWELGKEELLWTSSYLGNIRGNASTPIKVGSRLVVPAAEFVYVLNANTGATIKRIRTSKTNRANRFAGAPMHYQNGDVYIGSWNHTIYGINVNDSSLTPFMEYNAGDIVSTSPTLLDRGSSADLITFGVTSQTGKIVVINPSQRRVQSVKSIAGPLATAGVSPDGHSVHYVDVYGRIATYNARNDSTSVINGIYNLRPNEWNVTRVPSYHEERNSILITANRRSNGHGYIYEVNPSTGARRQIYSSSQSINSSPIPVTYGSNSTGVMFVRSDGTILGRLFNGAAMNWYVNPRTQQRTSSYRLSDASSFAGIIIGGGRKRYMAVNGADGVQLFEPNLPNIRANWIRAYDKDGNQRTTFKDNEPIRITGSFTNNGIKAASNVQHTLVRNGSWQGYHSKSYNIGQTQQINHNYTQLPAGTYTLQFRSDPNNLLKESDETDNNTGNITITVEETLPDIEGVETSIRDMDGNEKSTFEYGEDIRVVTYFQNKGDRDAGMVDHTHSLNGSWQEIIRSIDYPLGFERVVAKTYENLQPGTYTVQGVADPNNRVREHNKNNQRTPTKTFTVLEQKFPDLSGYHIETRDANGNVKSSFQEGEPIHITARFRNEGEATAFKVNHTHVINGVEQGRFYSHYNGNNAPYIDYAVNQSRFVTKAYNNLPPGTYRVSGIVDPDNDIEEVTTSNNETETITFTIEAAPLPDITALEINAYDGDGNESYEFDYLEPIRVVSQFRNIGQAPLNDPNYPHVVYLNGKELRTVNANYPSIGQTRHIPTWFSEGRGNSQEVGFLEPGVHELKVVADPSHLYAEENNNNNMSETIQIVVRAPKIVGDDITARDQEERQKSTFQPKDEISIEAFFSNKGDTAALNVPHEVRLNGNLLDDSQCIDGCLRDYLLAPNHQNRLDIALGSLPRGEHTVEVTADPDNTQSVSLNQRVQLDPVDTRPHYMKNPLHFPRIGNDIEMMRYENMPINTSPGGKNTVEFWMKWDGVTNVMPFGFDRYSLYITNDHFGINTQSSDVLGFQNSILKDKWTHVAVVMPNGTPNASNTAIYLNGEKQELNSYFMGDHREHREREASTTFTVGGWNTDERYRFRGDLSDIRVWNHERTQTQIRQNFEKSITSSQSGLVFNLNGPEDSLQFGEHNGEVKRVDFTVDHGPSDWITFGFWMKWDGKQGTMPFRKGGTSLFFKTDGYFGFNTGRGDALGIPSAPLKDRWVHVAGRIEEGVPLSSSSAELFINGVKQPLVSRYGTIQEHGNTSILRNIGLGATPSGANLYTGEMADLKVWNGFIPEVDIQKSMSMDAATNHLLAHHKLDSYSTDQSYDLSGNGKHSTNNGFESLKVKATPDYDNGEIRLEWNAALIETNYKVYRDGILIHTGGQTTFTDSGLELDNNYHYEIIAESAYGKQVGELVEEFVGKTLSITFNVEGAPPTANFNAPNTVYQREDFTLQNFTTEPDGDEVSYTWLYKRASEDTTQYRIFSNEENPTFALELEGHYDIKLIAADIDGEHERVKRIEVLKNTLHPGFTHSSPYYIGDEVNLTSIAYDEDGFRITSHVYTITLPDGSKVIRNEENPTFIAETVGLYHVEQIVKNELGNKAEYIDEIEVLEKELEAGFTHDSPYIVGDEITLTSTATSDDPLVCEYYEILAPDGSTMTLDGSGVTFTATHSGIYDVTQVVCTDRQRATSQDLLFVDALPEAGFEVNPNPTTRLINTHITNTATHSADKSMMYIYEYRVKGSNDPWKLLSTAENPKYTFTDVTTFEIRQTVTDEDGGVATTTRDITVQNLNPTALFDSDQSEYNLRDTMKVIGKATDPENDQLTYIYTITSPNLSTHTVHTKDFEYTVTQVGTYLIQLVVTDEYGGSDTLTKTFDVITPPEPQPDFTFNPDPTDRTKTTFFTNQSSHPFNWDMTYQWSFRIKGTSTWTDFSTATNPNHIFSNVSIYEVRLTATAEDVSAYVIKDVPVMNLNPVANFTASPNPTDRTRDVQFTNTSNDPEGDSLTYRWEQRLKGTSSWSQFSTATNPNFRFSEVGTYEVRLTATDTHSANHSRVREVVVNNLAPTADFSINSTPTNRLTTVSFSNTSSDPEGDSMTYRWEQRIKGTNSWSQFSTSSNPSFTFPEVGTYEVRLTVTDTHDANHSRVREVVVTNLPPTADFTAIPNPADRISDVRFTNTSTDPEDDTMTYRWEERVKGTSTWNQFSTTTNPDFRFTEVETYEVRLTVTDSHGASHLRVREVEVNNLAPTAQFELNQSAYYIGDTLQVTGRATDPENDEIEYLYTVTQPNNASNTFTTADFTLGLDQTGEYQIQLLVTDEYGATDTASATIVVNPLTITGYVKHTEEWERKHLGHGNNPNQFYSGETFILEADVSNYPIDNIDVSFVGARGNGSLLELDTDLTRHSNTLYVGELYDASMIETDTMLRNGQVEFEFTVQYSNGYITTDKVFVEIIGSAYDALNYFRSN